jgi:peroxiredoxin
MVLTESAAMAIGSRAPKFSLPDTRDNQQVSLSDHKNKPVLIVFMCNHCPYVVHLLDELAAVAHQFASDGITTITISSNDSAKYPQDGPEKMGDLARQNNWQFPYCFDESQTVAQAYGAVCTPDETRPGHGQAHGGNLKKAAASLLAGKSAPSSTHPSVGCSIKWKD